MDSLKKSKFNSISVGLLSGFLIAFIVTSVIIYANSGDYKVIEHYQHFFDKNGIGRLLRARVLMSLKGGAIAVLPLFYLFLNKKMMNAVKGLIAIVAVIGILVVWGILS